MARQPYLLHRQPRMRITSTRGPPCLAQYRWAKLVGQLGSLFGIETEGLTAEVNTITTNQTFRISCGSNTIIARKRALICGSRNFSRVSIRQVAIHQASLPQVPLPQVPLPQVRTSAGATSTGATSTGDTSTGVTSTGVDFVESNNQYETRAGMNYQLFPKTKIGFEGVGGILDQSSSPLQYYQQARLRVNYVATGKLDFQSQRRRRSPGIRGTRLTSRSVPSLAWASNIARSMEPHSAW